MKKLFLLFTVLCATIALQAQVISAYTAEVTQGTYTAITGGVAMDTTGMYEEDAMIEKAWYPNAVSNGLTAEAGFPIGFDFEFNDILCNQFVIGTHGYIALGRDQVSIDASHGKWIVIREDDADNIIGIIPNADIVKLENTEVSYKLEGEAPNRTLVVQYDNWGVMLGWDEESIISVDCQIRLHETTNTIELVFGEVTGTTESSKGFRMGLRGYYEDQFSIAEGEEEGMLNFVGEPGDNAPYLGVADIVNGATFTFTPPAPCVAPVEAVTDLALYATTLEIYGKFTKTTDADKYLIMLTEGACADAPVNGTFYHPLDSLGNSIVMTFDAEDTITMPWQIKLKASTEYEVSLYPANTLCTGGPLYGPVVKGKISSKPGIAEKVDITGTELNSLTFDVVANEVNNVMVLLTDSVRENRPYANVREFGNPQGPLAVGDIVDGLGRVVYMGPTAQGVVVEGLESSTAYYLRAISYDADFNYATEYVEDCDATVNTLPWCPNLAIEDRNAVPAGWTAGGQENFFVNESDNGYGDDEWNLMCNISQNPTNGALNTISFGRFLVDKRDAAFSFTYNMHIWQRFGGNQMYAEWAENDTLAVQVRRDGGEFENKVVILASNNVKPEVVTDFIPVELDLTEYVNETIEIRIYWNCFAGQGVRGRFQKLQADGRPIPVIPVVSVNEITWNSANVTWRGEQENYEFAYAVTGEEFTTQVVNEKAVALTDLTHLTSYDVKVRGIVAEGDTTEWSEVVTFTTADLPVCPIPTGLTHGEYGEYGDKLMWDMGEEHLYWDLRYREATGSQWTQINEIYTNEYELPALTPNVVYFWRLRAHCDMDRVSEWASQEQFTSNEFSAISVANANRLKVATTNGAVNIINSDVYVKSVTLYDMQGRVINHFEVNGRENIYIPTNMKGVALVKVATVDKQLVYKVNVK